MTYYREATVHTQELLDLLVKCENKIQTVSGLRPLFCPAGLREVCYAAQRPTCRAWCL